MKLFMLLFAFVTLIFIGCSTTYEASKYHSKEEFYKQFNAEAKYNLLNITVQKDTNLIQSVANSAEIENDSLSMTINKTEIKNIAIPVSQIEYIDYKDGYMKSADVLLKNGQTIYAENIKLNSNNLNYTLENHLIIQNKIPLNLVKDVNFNVHSDGTTKGILAGMGVGLIVAFSKIIHAYNDQIVPPGESPRNYNFEGVAMISIPLGGLIGGIIGRFLGYNYTFEFNP